MQGKYGNALQFTGATNSYVNVPDSASLDLKSALTLEAWVNPSSLKSPGGNWDAAVAKDHPPSTSQDISYALYGATGSGTAPGAHILVGNSDVGVSASSQLALKTWTFLAATYDGSALRMYVNGNLVSTRSQTGSIVEGNNPLKIGGDWDKEMFTGIIDNVRIYNTALTQSQIQSDMNTAVSTDTQPPTAPTNLVATGGIGKVSLTWNASTDDTSVTQYNVYRSTVSGFTASSSNQIGTSTTTSYTDSVSAGTYYYLVTAQDSAGLISPQSNQATGTSTADAPPTAPTNLVATGGVGSVSLTWNPSTDDTSVTQYDVFRSTVSGFTPSSSNQIGTSTTTSYTDSVSAGTYYYLVEAQDSAGLLSSPSNQATGVSSQASGPTVTITSPAANSTVSGTVTLTATASDPQGIAWVQFQIDGVNYGPHLTTAPYSESWDTTAYSNGNHTITAIADNNAGVQSSTSETVTVSNSTSSNPPRPQPTTLNKSSPQYQNLVADFPLWVSDPTANTTDMVNGLVGTPSNVMNYNDPVMGPVFQGDGTARKFTVPYSSILDFGVPNSQAFSYAAWVRITINSSQLPTYNNPPNMYVYTFDNPSAPYPGHSLAAARNFVDQGSASPIVTEFAVDSGSAQVSDFGNVKLNDGNWHQIVCVYQCPAGADQNTYPITGQIYVDGVLDVQSNGSQQDYYFYGIGSPGTSQPLYMGTDDDGATSCWNGDFCDLRFYNVALTASQVSAMYAPATRWQLYSSGTSPRAAVSAPVAASADVPDSRRLTSSPFRDVATPTILTALLATEPDAVTPGKTPRAVQGDAMAQRNLGTSVAAGAQLGINTVPLLARNYAATQDLPHTMLSGGSSGSRASEDGLDYFLAAAAGFDTLA